MPVLPENQEKRTGSRGRRWLWLLAIPPLLALLLLLAPLTGPIVLNHRGQWVMVMASTDPTTLSLPGGFSKITLRTATTITTDRAIRLTLQETWTVRGAAHVRWFRIGRLARIMHEGSRGRRKLRPWENQRGQSCSTVG